MVEKIPKIEACALQWRNAHETCAWLRRGRRISRARCRSRAVVLGLRSPREILRPPVAQQDRTPSYNVPKPTGSCTGNRSNHPEVDDCPAKWGGPTLQPRTSVSLAAAVAAAVAAVAARRLLRRGGEVTEDEGPSAERARLFLHGRLEREHQVRRTDHEFCRQVSHQNNERQRG